MPDRLDRSFSHEMGRRDVLRYAGMGAGMTAVLAACKKASDTSSAVAGASHPPMEQEPGTLQVFDWSGYGNGDYYPDKERANLWEQYAKETGDIPKFILFENDDAGFAKVAQGTHYDIVHPCAYRFQDYVDLGAMQPWDTSQIPNFASLNPVLQAAGQVDGKQYEIELDWGYSAPLIRADMIDPNLDSYDYLFTDQAQGKISWFDTPWILQMAAIAQGMEPNHSFDMTSTELEDITNYTIDVGKRNLYNIWVNYQDMWDDVQSGNVWTTYAWPDAYVALKDKVDVKYVRPSTGTLAWVEGLVLRANTPNYHHAHAFADAWAASTVGEKLISTWGYGHSNLDVNLDKIDPDVVEVFGLADPEASLSEPLSYLDRFQPQRNAYNRAWNEVKASLG
jgi:spermidine/putrescine-binding protein